MGRSGLRLRSRAVGLLERGWSQRQGKGAMLVLFILVVSWCLRHIPKRILLRSLWGLEEGHGRPEVGFRLCTQEGRRVNRRKEEKRGRA